MKKTYKVKKSNAPKTDKQVSTNDQANSSKNKLGKNGKNSKKNMKSAKTQANTVKKEVIKDNLTLLKEKTASLESDLSKMKLNIDIERNNSIQDTNNLNEKIKQANNEINRLIVDNKYLTNSL